MTYHESNHGDLGSKSATRNEFATHADVRRVQKAIEEETIRLASQDGASVLQWAKKLREEGDFVTLKSFSNPPPT
jgi:hypothetical protein